MKQMYGKQTTRVLMPIAGALMFLGACTHVDDGPETGICTFSIERTSQGEAANGKCAKASSPGKVFIRSRVKRADDEAEYTRRARLAGQQLTCDLVRKGRSGGRIDYRVVNCRR